MYARVEEGIVKEIIKFNPKGKFTEEIEQQFVECDETVKQGFKLEDGVFKYKESDITNEEFNNNIISKIKATDSQLTRFIEDIIFNVIKPIYESNNIQIPTEIIELITYREELRGKLK